MNMNRWPEAQQLISTNPNPNSTPASISIDPPPFYTQHYPFYSEISLSLSATTTTTTTTATQIHHIIPYSSSSSYSEMALRPPGIDPVYHPHALAVGAIEAHAVAAAAPYYQDNQQSSVAAHEWAKKEAIRQYGVDPYSYPAPAATGLPIAMDPMVHANQNPMLLISEVVQPSIKKALKRVPRKTKIMQSAWCEVCKLDCNSKDVLVQHNKGKKHKKNLEKLEQSTKQVASPASTALQKESGLVIGPPENPSKTVDTQQSKKKAASSASKDDLETKRRKVMEGGAAAEAVRVCTTCNVVCNSETVFNFHLAGQKHASMVKKLTAGFR
ncbi:hypothetical protein Syun_023350 [Stephania yunnanensis]|uniref:U1-type domain-containing protein n=1 Tax=Stephania yunnanensis TaxID=152371 RepID=A0AAP0I3R5_9MAGN